MMKPGAGTNDKIDEKRIINNSICPFRNYLLYSTIFLEDVALTDRREQLLPITAAVFFRDVFLFITEKVQ